MKNIYFVLIYLMLTSFSFAEEKSSPLLVTNLFEVMQMDKQMANKAQAMREYMDNLSENNGLTEQEKMEMEASFSSYVEKLMGFFRSEKVMLAFKESYAAIFTDSEIQALIDFYSSPVGQKFLEKSPDLNKNFMRRINPDLISYAKELEASLVNVAE